jgi:hypothetical protein
MPAHGEVRHDRESACNSTVDLQCSASRHGTRAAYVRGCRCPDARRANREYAKYRDRRTAQAEFGAADPFSVPAATTRAVIEQLRGTGWTLRRIEATTGIGRDHLSRINGHTKRPLRRVRWATHQKLSALLDRDPVVAAGALIDAYATWQRVHGLIALGYPKVWIARQLGHDRALQLGEFVVTTRNAEKISDLADHFGATRGPSEAARRYAAARGWTPELLWAADDYEDTNPHPAALTHVDPVVVERLLDGEPTKATRSERLEAVRILRAHGMSRTQIADRLHISGATVNTALRTLSPPVALNSATAPEIVNPFNYNDTTEQTEVA